MPSGMGGSLTLPGVPEDTLDVQEWSIDKACDPQEVTDTGSQGWKDYEGGNKGWSGRFSVVLDPVQLVDVDLLLDIGDQAAVEFNLGTLGLFYAGNVLITGLSTRNPAVGDTVIRQDCTYQGDGPLTNPASTLLRAAPKRERREKAAPRADGGPHGPHDRE